jgi:hypothetical protein
VGGAAVPSLPHISTIPVMPLSDGGPIKTRN